MDGANGIETARAGKPIALPCRVDADEALRYLGYRGQTLDDDLRKRLDAAASLCERELQPTGMFAIFPLVHAEEREQAAVAVETPIGPLELPGRAIARHLRGCGEVALMAVTLGAKSEMLLRRETALSATGGMLADVCASSAVEQAANVLNEHLRAQANQRGFATTWRFSPGYGDLPLSVQPDFLKVLGADKALGISLTPALMLVPAKTITAIVGLYRPEDRPRAGAGSQGEALNRAKPEAGHGKKAAGRPEADAFGRTEAGESREATAPAGATCPGARPREAKGTEDGMPS